MAVCHGFGLVIAAFGACSFEDTRAHCEASSECGADQKCYQGFCIARDDDARDAGSARAAADAASPASGSGGRGARPSRGSNTGATQSASTAAGKGGQSAGSPEMSGPAIPPAANGDGTPAPSGSGGSGMSAPPPSAAGMSAPAAGSGVEPPAAGSGGPPVSGECRDGEERDCTLGSPNASDGCNRGYQRCAGAAWGACTAQPLPAIEQCNGVDDDCDGKVDEQSDVDCYPNGQPGCTSDAGGHWSCQGACALGKRVCASGRLGDCAGYHTPSPESCTTAGTAAVDEDCNGMTDETCACMSGEKRSCYGGPEGTLGVGKCVAGTQTCTNGMLEPCTGAVTPVAETCNGADDDCNGKVDDKIDLQSDAMNCGACGKACASGEACCGGKCASTASDGNNCGACGTKCAGGSKCEAGKCTAEMPPPPPPPPAGSCTPACAAGQTCCSGACVDTKSDAKNCGACGMACTAGMQPGCCGGKCVDLVSNSNCGQCGKDCSLLSTSSITCTCTRDGSGKVACTGPVLNLCL